MRARVRVTTGVLRWRNGHHHSPVSIRTVHPSAYQSVRMFPNVEWWGARDRDAPSSDHK